MLNMCYSAKRQVVTSYADVSNHKRRKLVMADIQHIQIISRKQAIAQGLKRYFTGKPCKWGHIAWRRLCDSYCYDCARALQKKKGYAYPDSPKSPKNWKKEHKEFYNPHYIAARHLNTVRTRAKKKGRDFNLTLEDMVIPSNCKICGTELKRNKLHAQSNTPSVDRIDNSLGYIKGNVAIICYRCNTIKGNMTIAILANMLAYMQKQIEPFTLEDLI